MARSLDLHALVDGILSSLVPQALPRQDDHEVLERNRAWLLSLEDELVALFYDTLYAYPTTAEVFVPGERTTREQTLRGWWQRTVGAPIDMDYFRWMGLVGIVHIKRKVTNPMMLSMLQVVSDHVVLRARSALGDAEATQLQQAFARISTTVGAIISETYTMSYVGALEDLAGLDPKLTARMLELEVKRLEQACRAQLG
ncbi:MAG: protoglobin domain-containing protein [Actinomycetota bacterium]|nr:protoglobin domain-containing protein [Actinomycetota bacterium]